MTYRIPQGFRVLKDQFFQLPGTLATVVPHAMKPHIQTAVTELSAQLAGHPGDNAKNEWIQFVTGHRVAGAEGSDDLTKALRTIYRLQPQLTFHNAKRAPELDCTVRIDFWPGADNYVYANVVSEYRPLFSAILEIDGVEEFSYLERQNSPAERREAWNNLDYTGRFEWSFVPNETHFGSLAIRE